MDKNALQILVLVEQAVAFLDVDDATGRWDQMIREGNATPAWLAINLMLAVGMP